MAARPAGRADQCPPGNRHRRGAGLFLCYLTVSGKVPVTSDGAGNAPQAWNMLHGNWLLRGWWLSDVSFYTTELPEYMLVETVRGLTPAVVHVSAALTYTLLLAGAGAHASQGHPAGAALLFGVTTGNHTALGDGLALLHLVGLGLAIWGVGAALWRLPRLGLADQLLVAAVLINLAAYIFLTPGTLV